MTSAKSCYPNARFGVNVMGVVRENNMMSHGARLANHDVYVRHQYEDGTSFSPNADRDELTTDEQDVLRTGETDSRSLGSGNGSFQGFTGGDKFTDGQLLTTAKTFEPPTPTPAQVSTPTVAPIFRGRTITTGSTFTFNQRVLFRNSSNVFRDESAVDRQVSDLANFLNSNPSANARIVGNLYATDLPIGNSATTLNAQRNLNGRSSTGRGVMLSRAAAVRDKLIHDFGVNPAQLSTGSGSNYHAERGQEIDIQVTR